MALGNWLASLEEPPDDAVKVLIAALSEPEPMIRGHAAWALGRVLSRVRALGDEGHPVVEALLFRIHEEDDPWVEEEIEEALRGE